MNLNVGSIYYEPFVIGIVNQRFKYLFPNAFVAPTTETSLNSVPVAVIRRQVAPWRAGAQYPQHGVNKQPGIMGITAPCPLVSYRVRLQQFPNCIRYIMPSMPLVHLRKPPIVFSLL
jgi:hypothetical protein